MLVSRTGAPVHPVRWIGRWDISASPFRHALADGVKCEFRDIEQHEVTRSEREDLPAQFAVDGTAYPPDTITTLPVTFRLRSA